MFKKITKKALPVILAVAMILSTVPFGIFTASAATTVTVLDGQVSITDTATSMSESNGTVTVTAKGGLLSQTTNTITITNKTSGKAQLSFNYSASNYSSFSESTASGTKTVLLDGGGTVAMSIKGKRALSSNTATLTLSNFSLTVASDSSNVTFDYDSTYGSVTVDGAAVAVGDVKEIGISGATLVATALNGATFKGWINAENGAIISTAATYTYTPASDISVKAVFIGANSAPHFALGAATQNSEKVGYGVSIGDIPSQRYYYTVGSYTHIFDNLRDATTVSAASNLSKTVVLLNSGTLPADYYTIPAGVTLLIPFDSANTMYTTEGSSVEYTSYSTPKAYCTLTLASGANISVNGAISVSAKHTNTNGARDMGGAPTGDVAFINMKEGSQISVNNGGALYAHGFVTGSGSVTAHSGAKVYELFQLSDFRGGDQSTNMENSVFPDSQYYIQNIEVPLTIHAGAIEYGYTTVNMQGGNWPLSLGFIGSSGTMFNLTSGYVVKRYDGATDRLIIDANGTLSIDGISMDLGIASIDSSDYILPINHNITVNVNSGSSININQDVALLPGSKIILNEGATGTLASGCSIIAYDADQWAAYCGAVNKTFIPVKYAPGRTYNRTDADLVDAEICVNGSFDASVGYLYTTEGGANIYSTVLGATIKTNKGTNTTTYQITQADPVADSVYTPITITPAKLKNENGIFVNTATDTYTYDGNKWVCTNHNYESKVTEPTCDQAGYTTYTCTICGHNNKSDETAELGHNYEDVVTEPTCDKQGFTTHTCSRCGDSYTDTIVAPTGDHKYNAVVTAPTCTEKGYTTYTCSECGDSYVDNYVDALQHNYNAVVTDPTCDSQGFTTYTCSVCKDTYVEDYTAATHSYSDEFTVDIQPTDLNEGSKSRHCANCDEKTDVTVIPANTKFKAEIADGKATITAYNDTISGRFNIPETLDGNTVTAIADSAFKAQSGLTIIKIPSSVVNISATAFDGCTNLLAINYNGTFESWKNNVTLGENAIPNGVRINYLLETVGDLDYNGDVNATDMTYLIDLILKGEELDEYNTYLYDINADYSINLLDLVRIKKYLAGKFAYLGHETASETEELVAIYMASYEAERLASAVSDTSEEPQINDYETFLAYSDFLEQIAYLYMLDVDATADPVDLYIKYIRTGVDRYNSGSWGIMAGYENKDFAQFVKMIEDMNNETLDDPSLWVHIDSLKNINNFYLPNGDYVDFGHMFGTMDMTYHNKGSQNHADVGGWTGDIVDLLTAACDGGVTGTLEEMVTEISEKYLNKEVGENGKFSQTDMYGDLDALYIMNELDTENYFYGNITALMINYFTDSLTMEDRAKYFIDNRMDGVSLRSTLRNEVYNAYTGNMVITTLEATRELNAANLADLRKASCYAFADYICKLAGDYVDSVENNYLEAFSTTASILAPGVTQEIKYATTADDKQMVYYIATADLTRDDVNLYANYNNNDPAAGWKMQTVLDQANAAQNKYGNPDSKDYIENYNVIVSTNGSGFNMETGEPSGLLVMGGVEYHKINSNGFVGVLKDGTPVIGTTEEYNTIYKDKVQEAIAIFGDTLVKDGKIVVSKTTNYYNDRASRTAIGITKTGKIVMMVLDGRQEPVSCGGSMIEIAQIMLDAGCVHAVNLDGGGSTTFVSKAEGADELAVVNRPSDGSARSVSTSLMIVSTAPSSTAFDHAVIKSDYDYLTKGSSINLTASGVSATGNAAELPEGTSWAVSDNAIAEIDENGVLTAKADGTVNVYLMLGDQAIAVKSIGVVIPDGAYFTKNSVNAVYGSKVELPIKLTYTAKPVKHNQNDVALSMNNTTAGYFDGLYFIGNENSKVKNVTITVALKANSDTSDTMNIALFSQGEAVFDFDQATGGDKEMAWDRVVSNSTTDDALSYYVLNPDNDMVTSYTFAFDMSKISTPEQLGDLIYMLPGAGNGSATAWDFLCQLAERVSTLTEVKATIRFDQNVIVDYENLTIVNDYFVHSATEFDEASNTLTIILKWIDQTEPIDTALSNPICIVSGIKLTPKQDAAWDTDAKLKIINSGEVTYDVYLRANALYTFAQKEENQKEFGLYPFVNPDIPSEKGGYYSSVYKIFNDTYTLVSTLKNGWANEDGGFVYYVEGERLTGVNFVDEYYYDFGENGINIGQTKYTGLFYNENLGAYCYSKFGELKSGWHMIGTDWYYFHSDKTAKAGNHKVGVVRYDFEETGKVKSGVWGKTLKGTRYYYGPSYYELGWYTIDGKTYLFKDGYRCVGIDFYHPKTSADVWYDFGEDGSNPQILNGIYWLNGAYRYIENGVWTEKYLIKVGNDYYFAEYGGKLVTNKTINAWATNCDLPKGTYTFGPDGKMLGSSPNGEIIEFNGKLYYYENGKGVEKGLIKINGDYYFAMYKGELVTNQVYSTYLTNCDLPKGKYEFGADGKMLNGIVEKNGTLYYYENGVGVEKGLFKYEDDYYFAKYKGEIITNQVYGTYLTNCDLKNGRYEFGADGKMLQGIVEKDGKLYYYENGNTVEKGLFYYNGGYYFAKYKGEIITNQVYGTYLTNCDLPNSRYEFGADGKMLQGIIEKDGVLYYYENGKTVEKGLFYYNGNYYFAQYKGVLVTNKVYGTYLTNCDLPNSRYEFGPDGKMLNGIVEKDGVLYYYENGKAVEKGLFYYNGNYYFAQYRGVLVTNKVYTAYLTNCDLPKGKYEFGADGKMLNGIIEKNGTLYYYENGVGVEKGLFKYEDDYYFAKYKGELVVNQTFGAYLTNCDLSKGKYEFGADGKMLNGIIEKNGKLYYYENGVGVEKGLFYYDGHYYFAQYKGELIVNKRVRIWQGNGILIEDFYTFNELGQIVG